MKSALQKPHAVGRWWVVMALATAGSLLGGEAMRESGPSNAKGALGRNGRPSDPLLDRLVNATPVKPGRDDSGMVNPLLSPKPNAGMVDPLLQKQWNREIEKQRNWLLENATKIADPDKSGSGRQPERGLTDFKQRLEAESPASLRYLRARDAAISEAGRRPAQGSSDGLGPSPGFDPSGSSSQDAERRQDRPLDTTRIVQLGGDTTTVSAGRAGPGAGSTVSALRDVANPALPTLPGSPEDARKTLMEERNSAFEALLDTPPSGSALANPAPGSASPGLSPRSEPLSIAGFEPRRAPASRAQQFDALLGSAEGTLNTPAALARPTAGPLPTATRGIGLPDLAKPGGTPVASPAVQPVTRQPERRFQPQPAILEFPRLNQ